MERSDGQVTLKKEWPAGFSFVEKEKSSLVSKWQKLQKKLTLLPTMNLEQQGKEMGVVCRTTEGKGQN